MTSTGGNDIRCTVEGGDKLPPGLGGGEAICRAISRAALPALQRAGIAPSAVAVAVRVKSDSRMSAVASVNDKPLAEQNVATSDRALNAGAVTMLADAVAAELSRAYR